MAQSPKKLRLLVIALLALIALFVAYNAIQNKRSTLPAIVSVGSSSSSFGEDAEEQDDGMGGMTEEEYEEMMMEMLREDEEEEGDMDEEEYEEMMEEMLEESEEEASSESSESSESSAPDPDPKHCCLCQYQHVEGCDGFEDKDSCRQTACNDGVDNDGDGKKDYPDDTGCTSAVDHDETDTYKQKDCVWHQGSCMGWFESGCQKWKDEEPQKSSCDTMTITKDSERVHTMEALKGCTQISYYRDGHGQGCTAFAHRIIGCLHCTGPQCTQLNAVDIGCSTFQDLRMARIWMQNVQHRLAPGQHVTVTANQAVSTDTCTSELHYDLTVTTITEEPGQCHASTERCFGVGETAVCKQSDGTLRWEICCKGLPRNGGYWTAGNSCPPAPAQTINGRCRYHDQRYKCSDASAHAVAEAEQCLSHNRQECARKGYNTFNFPDCPIRKTSSTLFSCTYEGSCPWSCSYEEGA